MTTSAEGRVLRVAADQHGLFTTVQATALGLSQATLLRRVRDGVLTRVERGIYRTAGTPDTFETRVMQAVLSTGRGAGASHRTAAYLWELMEEPREVEVVAPRTGRRDRDFTLHQSTDLQADDLTSVRGIPTTTVARTIIDIGIPHGLGATARCIDEGRRLGLVQLEDAARLLHRVARKGRNGVGPARTIISERLKWNEVTDSQLEDRFLRLVQRAGLPRPKTQYRVQDAAGSFVARLDFAYPTEAIAVELDGLAFHSDPGTFQSDRHRQNRLVMSGWTVLRFTWWDLLAGGDWVLSTLQAALTPT